jgi:hypothetical protein
MHAAHVQTYRPLFLLLVLLRQASHSLDELSAAVVTSLYARHNVHCAGRAIHAPRRLIDRHAPARNGRRRPQRRRALVYFRACVCGHACKSAVTSAARRS